MPSTALVWIRNDLRVRDHTPLRYAADRFDQVVPVYCFDPRHVGTTMFDLPKMSAIRARFLCESVQDLRASLRDLGSDLVVRRGRPETVLPKLVRTVSGFPRRTTRSLPRSRRDARRSCTLSRRKRARMALIFGRSNMVVPTWRGSKQ